MPTQRASKPQTIDDYLAPLPAEQQAALGKLRATIRAAVPGAEECISYGLAAFKLHGKPLVALGATEKHCAFYLMSNSTVASHAAELAKYDTSTGTIRFAAQQPLPATLVKKLVQARIAENGSLQKKASAKAQPAKAQNTKAQPASGKPKPKKSAPTRQSRGPQTVEEVLAALKRLSSKKYRDGMARFAIPADNALGVAVGDLRKLAKQIGKNHELALALWETNVYEARMTACFIDDPALVTAEQMERWCREFDSWAICDTACFALFDRTPHAWKKVQQWATRKEEFVKRASFALLASLVCHDKQASDDQFATSLSLIEAAADDERNFVKKGVNWALRCIGKRNVRLHPAAVAVAQRLAERKEPAARWIGKDAHRELTSAAVLKRLKK